MFLKRKRKKPRKSTRSAGVILLDGRQIPFSTRDISITGALIHVDEVLKLDKGQFMEVLWTDMDVSAQVTLRWAKPGDNGGTLLGIHWEQVEGQEQNNRFRHLFRQILGRG